MSGFVIPVNRFSYSASLPFKPEGGSSPPSVCTLPLRQAEIRGRRALRAASGSPHRLAGEREHPSRRGPRRRPESSGAGRRAGAVRRGAADARA